MAQLAPSCSAGSGRDRRKLAIVLLETPIVNAAPDRISATSVRDIAILQ
jgi:hypothetical protein